MKEAQRNVPHLLGSVYSPEGHLASGRDDDGGGVLQPETEKVCAAV